jgi:hypothetical protein
MQVIEFVKFVVVTEYDILGLRLANQSPKISVYTIPLLCEVSKRHYVSVGRNRSPTRGSEAPKIVVGPSILEDRTGVSLSREELCKLLLYG